MSSVERQPSRWRTEPTRFGPTRPIQRSPLRPRSGFRFWRTTTVTACPTSFLTTTLTRALNPTRSSRTKTTTTTACPTLTRTSSAPSRATPTPTATASAMAVWAWKACVSPALTATRSTPTCRSTPTVMLTPTTTPTVRAASPLTTTTTTTVSLTRSKSNVLPTRSMRTTAPTIWTATASAI